MSQEDFSLANADGATFRADLNLNLQALASQSEGATAPTTTYAHQIWLDSTANLAKIRNSANTAWVTIASWTGTLWIPYRLGVALGTAAIETVGISGAVVPKLDGRNRYSAGQAGDVVTLTDAVNIATNMALANNFKVTLAGNRTLDNPTNQLAGQSGIIEIIQDATGSRTLAYGTNWDFEAGAAPVLSTAANAVDMLAYYVRASGEISANLTKGWQ